MKIVNLTRHRINLFREQDVVVDRRGISLKDDSTEPYKFIPPSGMECPVTFHAIPLPCLFDEDGEAFLVSQTSTTHGNLPEYEYGTVYVDSMPSVSTAIKAGRPDFFAVHQTVKDSTGRIVGCLGFCQPE
jgi:hypothetical protein